MADLAQAFDLDALEARMGVVRGQSVLTEGDTLEMLHSFKDKIKGSAPPTAPSGDLHHLPLLPKFQLATGYPVKPQLAVKLRTFYARVQQLADTSLASLMEDSIGQGLSIEEQALHRCALRRLMQGFAKVNSLLGFVLTCLIDRIV